LSSVRPSRRLAAVAGLLITALAASGAVHAAALPPLPPLPDPVPQLLGGAGARRENCMRPAAAHAFSRAQFRRLLSGLLHTPTERKGVEG
jgi:hypothetical protein